MRSRHPPLTTRLTGPLKPPDNDVWSGTAGRFRTCVRRTAALWTCPQITAAGSASLSAAQLRDWDLPLQAHLYTSNARALENGASNICSCFIMQGFLFNLFLHYVFMQWHCNHRWKPSWVSLPPSNHFHTWKLLNNTDKALFSCISTKKLSLHFDICPHYTFFSCLLHLMSSPCTCESAMRIKKLLSRHRLLFIFIFYYSILLFYYFLSLVKFQTKHKLEVIQNQVGDCSHIFYCIMWNSLMQPWKADFLNGC